MRPGLLIPAHLRRMTLARYIEAFKGSLQFHLSLMSIEQVEHMDAGARRELVDLVCEDVRRLYNISEADNKTYREAAQRMLDMPSKDRN